jgi:hypothetical protein
MSGPEKIWATMMDPEIARNGTFVDCAEYPQQPNADAGHYTLTATIPAPGPNPHDVARAALEAAEHAYCDWSNGTQEMTFGEYLRALADKTAALAEIVKGVKG